MKPMRSLAAGAFLAGLLAGCAGPMPTPDAGHAFVSLKGESQNTLLAEAVDGQKVDDGRYFELTPGTHRLRVRMFDLGYSDEDRSCTADLTFTDFKPGVSYHLVESSLAEHLRAELDDAHGHELAHTSRFACISA